MFGRQQNLLTDDFVSRETPSDAGGDGWFDLEDWVGPNHPSGRRDVAKLEAILANSGDYSLDRTQGPTGYWGLALDKGIRAYQKRNGLDVDGILRPDGPTIRHMADALGATLAGYSPPGPEDIERHHDTLGTGAGDVIVWRKPPVDFSAVPNLPEIDQGADASNARLVRTMLRTGDIDGYAPLMKDAVEQGGVRALAEVADLAKKLDEAQPGLGGKFASAVTGHLTDAQIDGLGIKVQPSPPLGTVQVAMMPGDQVMNGGRFIVEGTGGGGGPAGAAAGAAAAIAAGKALEQLLKPTPGRTPADPQAMPPVPGLVPPRIDAPGNMGGSIRQPKPEDMIETLPADPGPKAGQISPPALDPDERKQIVGKFLDQFNVVFNEGEFADNRGLPKTGKLNGVVAEACKKAIEESEFPELIKHLGGASRDGKEVDYMKERVLETPGKTRLPDYLMGTVDGDNNVEHGAAINTVTTRADGSPISREQAQLDDLIRSNVIRFVGWIAKVGDGNPTDSFDEAYRKCKEGVRILEEHIRADIASGKRKAGR